jgi:hypothetical protein
MLVELLGPLMVFESEIILVSRDSVVDPEIVPNCGGSGRAPVDTHTLLCHLVSQKPEPGMGN